VDWFHRHPGARARVAAVVGMEHLGQIEFVERASPGGASLRPSGRVDPSLVWVSDDDRLLRLAQAAVRDNELAGATVRNVKRPGIHGRSQGAWYGMAAPRRIGGKPAVAIMGTMGAYWSFASGLERLDAELFRRQAATFVQITDGLMRLGDLTTED
jgi:hypothetical protein